MKAAEAFNMSPMPLIDDDRHRASIGDTARTSNDVDVINGHY